MLAATLRQKSARDDGVGAHTVSEADDLDTSAAEAASGSLHFSRGSCDSPDRSERLKLRPHSFPTFWLKYLIAPRPLVSFMGHSYCDLCVSSFVLTCTFIWAYTPIMHIYICDLYVYIYIYVYICMYVFMYVCMYVCVYIYIYT